MALEVPRRRRAVINNSGLRRAALIVNQLTNPATVITFPGE
jgi:hypothetical protein